MSECKTFQVLECVQQGASSVHLMCMWDAWPMHEQALMGKSV